MTKVGNDTWYGLTNSPTSVSNSSTSVQTVYRPANKSKNPSITSQNYMEHGQSKKPVFKNSRPILVVHPYRGFKTF